MPGKPLGFQCPMPILRSLSIGFGISTSLRRCRTESVPRNRCENRTASANLQSVELPTEARGARHFDDRRRSYCSCKFLCSVTPASNLRGHNDNRYFPTPKLRRASPCALIQATRRKSRYRMTSRVHRLGFLVPNRNEESAKPPNFDRDKTPSLHSIHPAPTR